MEDHPLPWPWVIDYTAEGDIFYTNQDTAETRWEFPSDEVAAEDEGQDFDHGEFEEWNDGSGEWNTSGGEWEDGAAREYDSVYDDGWDYGSGDINSPSTGQVQELKSSIVELPTIQTSAVADAWGGGANQKEAEIAFKVIQTPLFQACEGHDEETVLSILEEYPTQLSLIINQGNPAGITPLHVCCLFGSEKCAAVLVANNANIHAVDKFGSGCLHYLARSLFPSPNILRLLIAKGCDVFFEEKLAHYNTRQELVLEHFFLRASPFVWEGRLSSFDSTCPVVEDPMITEIPLTIVSSLPLPTGWEKYSDEIGTYYHCESSGMTQRERPEGTSPRGAYEYLLSVFNAFLTKCLPWHGGRGPSLKSGPDGYAEDDLLWEENSNVKLKIISALSVNSQEGDTDSTEVDALTPSQRRTLECYCILRREELRLGAEDTSSNGTNEKKMKQHAVKKAIQSGLLGSCGFWNPLVAMKVLSILMEKLFASDIEKAEQQTVGSAQVSTHIEGIAQHHISTVSCTLPVDFDVALALFEKRGNRQVQLFKSEKMLKRLESEGKKDGDQATKLRKEIGKTQQAFQDAHRKWLSKVAVEVLPKRVAQCEQWLSEMGFTLPVVFDQDFDEATASKKHSAPPDSVSSEQSPSFASSGDDNESIVSVESVESDLGDAPASDPPMPLAGWSNLDVAWAVHRKLPSSVESCDRRSIFKAIAYAEISGPKLFPLVRVDDDGNHEVDKKEEDDAILPANPAIFPKLSAAEILRIDFLVDSLGFDNKLKLVWISTAMRGLLLKSKRWSQLNATTKWDPPNSSQEEDGRLLEHVLKRIGTLMVSQEGSLQEMTKKLRHHQLEANSIHSHSSRGSVSSILGVLHAKEIQILEQHVQYQHEQRSLLGDKLALFKAALLPLPTPSAASSPPTSPLSPISKSKSFRK